MMIRERPPFDRYLQALFLIGYYRKAQEKLERADPEDFVRKNFRDVSLMVSAALLGMEMVIGCCVPEWREHLKFMEKLIKASLDEAAETFLSMLETGKTISCPDGIFTGGQS